ncbi:MAG: nucleotidyltransferase family protein [Verrucomicrobiota bacterium]|nr:nucleotidyltransferase family protein [Verrucomicrobiota bacterium]
MRKIGAVILAAGEARRFGEAKQLVRFRGSTLLRRAVDAAVDSGCAPVVVVVGAVRNEIIDEVRGRAVQIAHNREWEAGIGTSISCGLHHSLGQTQLDGVVLLASDQPFVAADLIARLIAAADTVGKTISASRYAGTLGIPALFLANHFPALLTLSGELGAKGLIHSNQGAVAEIAFEKGAIDIDTRADFELLSRMPAATIP